MGIPYAEVIGDPIAHSKSPAIHSYWLKSLEVEAEYRATRVTKDELPTYLATRRADPCWKGCNVTMPHKQAIGPLLDGSNPPSDASNCVLFREGKMIGLNTDVNGIREATADWEQDNWTTLCVVGAGGATLAFLASFDSEICPDVRLIVRDRSRGERMRAHHELLKLFTFDEAEAAIEGCTALVNASPLGMKGFPPMPRNVLDGLCGLEPNGYVLDMVTSPAETELLRHAAELGLRPTDGLTMLIGQARAAFQQFFGLLPTKGGDWELRELLTP